MSKLFLPQSQLEEWALSERADIQGNALGVTGENATYPVTEAVHFTQIVSGPDERQLINKVKTLAQLESFGAEHMMTSVIAGETAYEVVQGYVVEAKAEVLGMAPTVMQAKAGPRGETDLLAAFLLDKL